MYIENKVAYGLREVRQYDVATAVALSIDGTAPDDTQAGRAEATADNAAAVLGRLVSTLTDMGLLDREAIQYIVGGNFVVVED